MDWSKRAEEVVAALPGNGQASAWRNADMETISKAVKGVSLYSDGKKSDGGARVTFNISSAHIPGFVADNNGNAYKNRYDASGKRIGEQTPSGMLDAREKIDQLLAYKIGGGVKPESLYYGAVELNGAGIRYYGDIGLILRVDKVDPQTQILDRNSFDLISEPLRATTHPNGSWDVLAATEQLVLIAGRWSDDLVNIAICKVLGGGTNPERRITAGGVSQGVLADEDYIEVIRTASFNVTDLAEARVSAADSAVDGMVADRLRRGPTPSWAELMWRNRRRKAEQALRAKRIVTRVVVSAGRVRT
jgi:hypothetical protein